MKQSSTYRALRCARGCAGNKAVCSLGIRLLSLYREMTDALPHGTSLLHPEQMTPDVRWLYEQSVLVGDAYLLHSGVEAVLQKHGGTR